MSTRAEQMRVGGHSHKGHPLREIRPFIVNKVQAPRVCGCESCHITLSGHYFGGREVGLFVSEIGCE